MTRKPWARVCVCGWGELLLITGHPWDPLALGMWGWRGGEQVREGFSTAWPPETRTSAMTGSRSSDARRALATAQ